MSGPAWGTTVLGTSMARTQHPRLKIVGRLALLGAIILSLVMARPLPAGAHAKITGMSPADGSVVEMLPDRVTVYFTGKPVTAEGDPLQVYGPTGERIDTGETQVSDHGRALTLTLDPPNDQPAGRFELVYRVISGDTHLVAGRFGFSTRRPTGAAGISEVAHASGQRLHEAGSADDLRSEIAAGVLAGIVLLIALRRGVGSSRRRRRAHSRTDLWREPAPADPRWAADG